MVNCGGECVLPRPFSIHHVINREDVKLYFSVLENGKGTGWLSQREKGDTVEMTYPHPLGNGFTILPASHNLLLVAGGMGVASLYFLAEETFKNGYSVTLMYGTAIENRYPVDYLTSGIKTFITTEDGTAGKKGMITDLLPDFADGADQIFACGPLPMYKAMAQMPELKDKPVHVSLEVRMGCGRGVCYGCTVKTKGGLKQVCTDGPVFDLENILWDELGY
jgi:dihydroorotate dehydrogenase electron transfer subunit